MRNREAIVNLCWKLFPAGTKPGVLQLLTQSLNLCLQSGLYQGRADWWVDAALDYLRGGKEPILDWEKPLHELEPLIIEARLQPGDPFNEVHEEV